MKKKTNRWTLLNCVHNDDDNDDVVDAICSLGQNSTAV